MSKLSPLKKTVHHSTTDSAVEYVVDLANRLDLTPLVQETSLTQLPKLSENFGARISLKREDQQNVFSFKVRGAYAKLLQLTEAERKQGVICASAGNHAQGVAVAAKHLGINATIVMPIITPDIKVNAVQRLGARVELLGENFDEACEYARNVCKQQNLSFIHPYDDLEVIAGQGTIGLELIQQMPDTDIVFLPVGGGGLASGVAATIKSIKPDCKIIGVEAEESASMSLAFKKGRPSELKQVGRFAEGVAVRQVGNNTYQLCSHLLDDVITVNNDEICAAVQDIYEETRLIPEPSGALSLAGVKRFLNQKARSQTSNESMNIVAVLSGANVNFKRLRYIAERADLGEQKEAIFAVTIPEEPGSFHQFCKVVGQRNITEFNYRYSDDKKAQVFVGIALQDGEDEKTSLVQDLFTADYPCMDLSNNEVAKSHVRYMVGGRSQLVDNEKLYRFSFPEQTGALLSFLEKMSADWSIFLFHYRNHGSDFGRVLVGMRVPQEDELMFTRFLQETGLSFIDETANPVNSLFL